ncbi:hypothetical protein DFQ26_006445 [Actinomortierella ambigua]|nr:hypothetical protein DFQ26_006445 [Actinomortierella ambigua]
MKNRKHGDGSGGAGHSTIDHTTGTSSSAATSSGSSLKASESTTSFTSTTSLSNTTTKRGSKKNKSNRASNGTASSSYPSLKSVHSQAALLEHVLTVTRGSLMIVTPLVAGMILQVGPRAMEPMYANVYAEEGFLENCLMATIFGAALALVYTLVLSSWATRTTLSRTAAPATHTKEQSSPNTATATTTTSSSAATTVGLAKDRGLQLGILVSLDLCAVVLASSFLTVHALFRWSDEFGPIRGPHLTQLALAYPVFALLAFANTLSCVLRSYEQVHIRTLVMAILIQVGAICGMTLVVFQMALAGPACSRIYSAAILLAVISGLHKLLISTHGEVVLPDEVREMKKKPIQTHSGRAKLALSCLPLALVFALAVRNATTNPQCQGGVIKAHNPIDGNYTILARNESVTGWVSVVDEVTTRHDLHIRVMRAGHSLIGGIYIETGDSIFGSFYIPEAVRLIKGRQKTYPEMALQIGLGVGVASGSLTRQGVLVDVVEIDPVVADYARQYFGWPKPHQLFIQDGRQFIEQAPSAKYDYVIHDVFTGGGVPPSLFSVEALLEIQRILKPDGILALNMVGSEHPDKSMALNSVRKTLLAVFPFVVAYKEDASSGDAYQNLVFFASPNPIEFETYTPPDPDAPVEEGQMPASVMRDWILSSFLSWPMSTPYDPALGELILDRNNTLNAMQREGALDHWHAMRSLFPQEFWLNY